MKVTLSTQALLEALGHAASVAAAKSPKPILECVSLHADGTTGLTIESTDLDVSVRCHLSQANVAEPGDMVVNASRVLAIVREIKDEETTLEESDGNLQVQTDGSVFRVRAETVEEFPVLGRFPAKAGLSVDAEALREMIRRTAFAAAKEAGRFALNGVQLKLEGKELQMVATDGRRLARITQTLDTAGEDLTVLVGPKALTLLERALGSGLHTNVEIAVDERQVMARSGDILVMSRLIDGSFPSVDNVIPAASKNKLRATAATLIAGLRRASLLTTRDASSVELDIDPSSVTIRSRAREVGEAKVEVAVEYDGEPMRIGFNPLYLQDALKVMDPAAEVELSLSDARSPGRLSDDPRYVYVISPVSLE